MTGEVLSSYRTLSRLLYDAGGEEGFLGKAH